MIGSDWPVVTFTASCDEWFSLVDGVTANLSPDERRWIEHRTAAYVYRLGGVDNESNSSGLRRPGRGSDRAMDAERP